ncbi:MAG: hypothetical protein AB7K52_11555 [Phycisphaerales bacterium]
MRAARRGTILIGVVLVASLAGWRLWPFVKSAAPAADQARAALAADGARWLSARAAAATPVQSPESFELAVSIDAVAADLARAGLTRQDARSALAHAAKLMHLRFVDRDFETYTRWREEQGYRFFPPERLRQEPPMRRAIELGAGRALRDDEADSRELWSLYWRNVIEPSARVSALDQTAQGSILLVWRSPEGLALRTRAPARRPVASPIHTGDAHDNERADLPLWRGAGVGQGWPVWFPPDEVEQRLEAPGTPFIEAAWVLRLEDGRVQPFALDMGMDPLTRRWWVMQWYVPHVERGVLINTGGL